MIRTVHGYLSVAGRILRRRYRDPRIARRQLESLRFLATSFSALRFRCHPTLNDYFAAGKLLFGITA